MNCRLFSSFLVAVIYDHVKYAQKRFVHRIAENFDKIIALLALGASHIFVGISWTCVCDKVKQKYFQYYHVISI